MNYLVTTGLIYQYKKTTIPVVCSFLLTVFSKPKKSSSYLFFLKVSYLQIALDSSWSIKKLNLSKLYCIYIIKLVSVL